MPRHYCPQCGTEANLLLNLVSCLTLSCRNYDSQWVAEWNVRNIQHYHHNDLPGINHRFLGCQTVNNKVFDLYCYQIPDSNYICLARCGDSDSDCYYIDDQETEIGVIDFGPVKDVPSNVSAALKEAVKRLRRKS